MAVDLDTYRQESLETWGQMAPGWEARREWLMARRLGRHARGQEGAARAGTRLPGELRGVACLRPRPRRSWHERPGARGRRRAPGLWKAVSELWPAADGQRCTVHALRNVTAKLPERHRELKARWWKLFDEASSPAEARRGLEAIVADYGRAYPAAMAVVERDADALVVHLRWPSEHRKRVRTTNLLERTFVEVRRRTKVIGRFPGETSALSLVWAVLELSSRGWRGVVMTPRTVAEVERLRHAREHSPSTDAKEVVAA